MRESPEGIMGALRAWLLELFHWVEGFAATPYGGWALFGIAFLESSVFPIPPDVLLIALCLGEPEGAFRFAAICSAGSVLGGCAGYGLGYYGGRPLLHRMFREEWITAVGSYFQRYNAWATGIAGLTPLPYKLFTISGGVFAVDFKVFTLASLVSRSLRFFLVASLLYFFGERVKRILEDYLGWLTIAFVILLLLGFWLAGRRARGVRGRVGTPSVRSDPGNGVDELAERWILSGRVQGVGFRYFTRQAAEAEGLSGWVRNLPDGTVELLVEGAEEGLESLARRLRQGPPPARVDELRRQSVESGGWQGFSIR